MGLDMYLSARKHINKINWNKLDHNIDTKYSEATEPQWFDVVKSAGVDTLVDVESIYGVDVSVNLCYWRKANQIHQWFVDNVQNGEDNCGEYYVSHEKLKELLTTCRQALFHKDPSKLMPQAGFFFGGTDIDEWYWADIKDTIKQIAPLVESDEYKGLSYYYQSSW